MRIDADFPGGNIVVDEVGDETVHLRQDLRDTRGHWFHWAFRVRGAAGRTVRFSFAEEIVGVHGPAVSRDGGTHWQWLGAEDGEASGFAYHFPAGAEEVRFSVGIPYMQADWARFLQRHQGHPRLQPGVLCASRRGRPVEMACIASGGTPLYTVLLTSRHHCCEAMATYALEGMVEAILQEADEAAGLAERATVVVVPFVDADGVAEGDQGKNRSPRDHCRDYTGESLYPETAAIRALAPALTGDRELLVFDLHCPGLRGDTAEYIYQVGSPHAQVWQAQKEFGAILEAANPGPLPYDTGNDMAFGESWNIERNYGEGRTLCRWAAEELQAPLTVGLEIPYANAGGVTVEPAAARQFGRTLARALAVYLRER